MLVGETATTATSDETEPFVTFTDSQQQHLVQFIVGGVNGEIQLVKTRRDKIDNQDMQQPVETS